MEYKSIRVSKDIHSILKASAGGLKDVLGRSYTMTRLIDRYCKAISEQATPSLKEQLRYSSDTECLLVDENVKKMYNRFVELYPDNYLEELALLLAATVYDKRKGSDR